jgi:DUF4097 and DUF4098 domain-containing protein YvlB
MEQTFDTPGPVELSIQLDAGDIQVRTTEDPTTRVLISGYATEQPPKVTCNPGPDGGYRVAVEHRTKKTWGFSFSRGVNVDVAVPAGTRVYGSSGAAGIEATGSFGEIEIRTSSGDIRFDDVTGDVQIACASGDVEGRSVAGHLSVKGASGDVTVGSVGGGVTVRSASGDVQVGRLDGDGIITVGSGDIDLRDVGVGRIEVRAIAGDVEVGVRGGLGVWLDVSSTTGDVHSALETPERSEPRSDPELELTIHTVSGDVDVRRAPARR